MFRHLIGKFEVPEYEDLIFFIPMALCLAVVVGCVIAILVEIGVL